MMNEIITDEKELQERFCRGCPTPDLEGEKKCPCPRGPQKDWRRCNWHLIYKKTGIWTDPEPELN